MERTKFWVLLIIFTSAASLAFLVRRFLTLRGFTPAMYGMEAGIVMLAYCIPLAWLGWQVRRLKENKETFLSPIGASRVAAAALATTHGGALIAGRFAGVLLVFATQLQLENLWGMFWPCAISLLCSFVMIAVGWWVELQCLIDYGDKGDKKNPNASAGSATATA